MANLLSGTANAAEANAQAGYTRHPVAYTSSNGPLNWTGHYNFLGALRRLDQPGPSSLDQDVYQVRRVPADPMAFDLLKDFVVWDCPDMTTWAASGYVTRLIEVSSLADVIVYVATSSRDCRARPTTTLLDSGVGIRYLSIAVPTTTCGSLSRSDRPVGTRDLICLFGDELRHAVEIGVEPHVRDQTAVRQLFRRIGYVVSEKEHYETVAAIEAQRAIARELSKQPPR